MSRKRRRDELEDDLREAMRISRPTRSRFAPVLPTVRLQRDEIPPNPQLPRGGPPSLQRFLGDQARRIVDDYNSGNMWLTTRDSRADFAIGTILHSLHPTDDKVMKIQNHLMRVFPTLYHARAAEVLTHLGERRSTAFENNRLFLEDRLSQHVNHVDSQQYMLNLAREEGIFPPEEIQRRITNLQTRSMRVMNRMEREADRAIDRTIDQLTREHVTEPRPPHTPGQPTTFIAAAGEAQRRTARQQGLISTLPPDVSDTIFRQARQSAGLNTLSRPFPAFLDDLHARDSQETAARNTAIRDALTPRFPPNIVERIMNATLRP